MLYNTHTFQLPIGNCYAQFLKNNNILFQTHTLILLLSHTHWFSLSRPQFLSRGPTIILSRTVKLLTLIPPHTIFLPHAF